MICGRCEAAPRTQLLFLLKTQQSLLSKESISSQTTLFLSLIFKSIQFAAKWTQKT